MLRLPTDADHLVDSLQECVSPSLHAHVGDVLPFVPGRRLAQRDQLLGVGVVGRGVLQGRANAQGAVAHLPVDEFAHLLQFGRRRFLVAESEDVLAHGRRTQERRHVLRNPLALQEIEVVAEGRPLDVVFEVRLLFLHALLNSRGWTGAPTNYPRP